MLWYSVSCCVSQRDTAVWLVVCAVYNYSDSAQLLGCVGKKGPAIYDLDPGYYSTHGIHTKLCLRRVVAQLPKKDAEVYGAYW